MRASFISLFFCLLAFSHVTVADVNSVSSTPSSVTISSKNTANISVQWRVNRIETVGSVPVTRVVSSASAVLQINGSTVATLNGLISTTSTLLPSQSETVSLSETLVLNTSLARQVASSPAGSVRIIRTFSDTQTVGTGLIRLFSGSSATGPLTVRRIDLSFENDARTDVIHQGEAIRAVAEVSFRSSGILRGEWRLVDPTASLGSSGGRVLQVIRQNLVSSGEGRTRIVSPPLPTDGNGLYLLAFSVQETNAEFEIPILRYFVLDKEGVSPTVSPMVIDVYTPLNGADLNKDTVFSWQAIKGAKAYQVALFSPSDDQALTGKLVPATELKLSLAGLSFDWLKSGSQYQWQVRALGSDGNVIGQSSLLFVTMP